MENNLSQLGSAANIAQRREPAETITYTEVLADGILYQVAEKSLQKELVIGGLVCVVWTGAIAVCILMGLVDLVDLSGPPALLPCSVAGLGCISISVIALLNRKLLPVHYTFSLLAVTAYVVANAVFFGLTVKYQWILALALTIVELVICILFVQNKRNIILVVLGGLQLILIGLKLDNIINAPWSTVFIIFMITALTLLLAAVILAIYGLALRFRDGRFTTQSVGIIYQGIFQLAVALEIGAVVGRVAYLPSSIYIGAPSIAIHILITLCFMYPFRMEIALHKAGAEMLSIIDPKITITKVSQQTTLYGLSSEWFTLSQKRSVQLKKNTKKINSIVNYHQQQEKRKQCIVCLTENASLIWMPCGHLTLCENCGKYMLDNSKLNCVLCKTKGQEVYHVQSKGASTNCSSDYYYQIRTI